MAHARAFQAHRLPRAENSFFTFHNAVSRRSRSKRFSKRYTTAKVSDLFRRGKVLLPPRKIVARPTLSIDSRCRSTRRRSVGQMESVNRIVSQLLHKQMEREWQHQLTHKCGKTFPVAKANIFRISNWIGAIISWCRCRKIKANRFHCFLHLSLIISLHNRKLFRCLSGINLFELFEIY